MIQDELNNRYFNWMSKIIHGDERYDQHSNKHISYNRLLYFLHSMDFTYSIPMDENRYADGTDLRYRFCYENNLDSELISKYLDNRPCTVLEMLVALSVRLEESIMYDQDIGDRTGEWFWGMIDNLGLAEMDDGHFDKIIAQNIIWKFLNRGYERNGKGGLFTIDNRKEDLRDIEIWYQACWYLNEVV